MKRTILASIIGISIAMSVTSAQAQGRVTLDSYTQSGSAIVYGAGVPSGGFAVGSGIYNLGGITWTIGIYGAIGTVSVAADPTGVADPSTLGAVSLLSGSPGDIAVVSAQPGAFWPSDYPSSTDAVLPGYTSGPATFVVVAYSGSSYDSSQYRGHSTAITDLTPATGLARAPFISSGTGIVGGFNGMQSFSVFPVPEPSMFTLSGIGALTLLLVRRKK